MASSSHQLPQLLIDAFAHQRIVLLVGSGPSISASLPNWSQLLAGIAKGAGLSRRAFSSVMRHIENEHFLDVADYLREALHRGDFFRLLERELMGDHVTPKEIHKLLMELPTEGVITTNYDRLLDKADTTQRLGLPFTWRDNAIGQRLGKPFLFHAHGSLDDPESIIISGRDYERLNLSGSEHYRKFLQAIFSPPYRVLFIGFGFRDPDLNLLLTQVRQAWRDWHNPPYAVIEVEDPDEPDHVNDGKLRRLGLQPILIPAKGTRGAATHEWLAHILELLGRSQVRGVWGGLPPMLLDGLVKTLFSVLENQPDVLQKLPLNENWRRRLHTRNIHSVEDYISDLDSRGVEDVRTLVRELLRYQPSNAILRNIAIYLPPSTSVRSS